MFNGTLGEEAMGMTSHIWTLSLVSCMNRKTHRWLFISDVARTSGRFNIGIPVATANHIVAQWVAAHQIARRGPGYCHLAIWCVARGSLQ
jgi:hypothetical protein